MSGNQQSRDWPRKRLIGRGFEEGRFKLLRDGGFWVLRIDRPTAGETETIEAEVQRQIEILQRRGEAARTAKRTKPLNIVEFIASIGGISDPDGGLSPGARPARSEPPRLTRAR